MRPNNLNFASQKFWEEIRDELKKLQEAVNDLAERLKRIEEEFKRDLIEEMREKIEFLEENLRWVHREFDIFRWGLEEQLNFDYTKALETWYEKETEEDEEKNKEE